MAKKKAVTEEIPTIDVSPKAAAEVEPIGDDPDHKVKVILPVQIKINRIAYGPGPVIVPAHMVDTMVEMVDKKKRADLSVFTGNNYLVQRMVDRSLVVSKVEKI